MHKIEKTGQFRKPHKRPIKRENRMDLHETTMRQSSERKLLDTKRNAVRLCTAILVLTAIDQLIKYIISRSFFHSMFGIIPGILTFKPVHNTDMSWLGSLGIRIFANYHVTIIINLLILVTAIVSYRYLYRHMGLCGRLTQSIFILLFSAVLCSTIDRMFWKGSIDYIRLEGFFTFDLKDFYITVFTCLLISSYVKYKNAWKTFSVKNLRKVVLNNEYNHSPCDPK